MEDLKLLKDKAILQTPHQYL